MSGRQTPATPTVCTLRAHSWIVRLAALWIAFLVLSPVLKSSGRDSSQRSWLLVAFLVAIGLLIPVALLVWDGRRGVHIREDGIRSVSANGSRFLAWSEIAGFETDRYLAGTIAVYATRPDGARVALSDTARWPYQRATVERMRDELAAYRNRWLR